MAFAISTVGANSHKQLETASVRTWYGYCSEMYAITMQLVVRCLLI